MRAEVDVRPVRERRPARSQAFASVRWRVLALWTVSAVAALTLAAGIVFAGSVERIPAGVTIAGVKVSGLTPEEAERRLAMRAARYASIPVVFTADGKRWELRPSDLEVRVDWGAAAEEAREAGDWPLPVRGLKRVAVRLFGTEVEPRPDVFDARLEYEVGQMSDALGRSGRDAAIVLRGVTPVIVPGRDGRGLDARAARETIIAAVTGFDRRPVELPVRVTAPAVDAEDLEPAAAQVRTALSAPVRFGWRDAHWLVQPRRLAELLALPANGSTELRVAGPEAKRYFNLLSRAIDQRPQDAKFIVRPDETVRVVPSRTGRALDVEASAKALLAGALATDRRDAELVVRTLQPELTTERARAMRVTRVLATYATGYSGSYDRIRNLKLAVSLVDGVRLAPGETFSFNETVGPRTKARGFRLAPTIVEGKYEDEVGGGVSQVATTIFNAAWEAGLKITARSAHTLYISRYPLGRDATVNYPDIDLAFRNDTDNWIVVRGFAGDTGISIALLGAPTNRRVVSEPGPLEEKAPPEVESIPDPTLYVGETVVVDAGEPSRSVTVTRTVYERDNVLYEEAWFTSYRSEPKIVRVGTIPRPEPPTPKPPAPPKQGEKDQPATTGPSPTTPTTPPTTTTTGG